PHVVPFYGVCRKGAKFFFISPYVENGNVREYLESLKSDGVWDLLNIAQGLKYLHENDILHLDVKPENALIDNVYRAMVTDFGTCLIRELEGRNHGVGTAQYMAPERLRGEVPTKKADVYAFGISLFEVRNCPAHASTMFDIKIQVMVSVQPLRQPGWG
ncbi:kinase-like protein, partial [Gonapodya prolifera JEL478]